MSLKGRWQALPAAHGMLSSTIVFEVWTELLTGCTVKYNVYCFSLSF